MTLVLDDDMAQSLVKITRQSFHCALLSREARSEKVLEFVILSTPSGADQRSKFRAYKNCLLRPLFLVTYAMKNQQKSYQNRTFYAGYYETGKKLGGVEIKQT